MDSIRRLSMQLWVVMFLLVRRNRKCQNSITRMSFLRWSRRSTCSTHSVTFRESGSDNSSGWLKLQAATWTFMPFQSWHSSCQRSTKSGIYDCGCQSQMPVGLQFVSNSLNISMKCSVLKLTIVLAGMTRLKVFPSLFNRRQRASNHFYRVSIKG